MRKLRQIIKPDEKGTISHHRLLPHEEQRMHLRDASYKCIM